MSKDRFKNEPPPGILTYHVLIKTAKRENKRYKKREEKRENKRVKGPFESNYNLHGAENEKAIFTSYVSNIEKDTCLPKSLREHIIIEYAATFVNLESDIVEFYLKLDNKLLMKFPFLHVDHPLHDYYQYVKLNTKKRMIDSYPNFVPAPLKELLQHVRKLEKEKISKNEIKTKMLKEKQIITLKDEKGKTKKQREREKEEESYANLFMKYMQSDEETDDKEEVKSASTQQIRPEDRQEMDDVIEKISKGEIGSTPRFVQILIQCIDKLKFLQYGSKEYAYFSQKFMEKRNASNNESLNITMRNMHHINCIKSADFLNLLCKPDERKESFESEAAGNTNAEENTDERGDVKMMQDYRRERAKLILHGFKKT
ncbi:conserved Plasmodium protein, unknown function [Plasmodium ovale curtisi]|uniref:SURP motif domain-containing protein n=1 Tax=Plasmodium ovale curtisi TaxID=864141 RepID=A0A1A8VZY0_PLAOA|nr:conserved Plasmodium protein, unknown function [Plasmodium ovale curtisi]